MISLCPSLVPFSRRSPSTAMQRPTRQKGNSWQDRDGMSEAWWDVEELPCWDEEWPRSPWSSGQEVLDLCSTLALTPTCLPPP